MMNKFKKWLIHRLGGYTKEDIDNTPVKYNVQNIKLESIKAIHYFDVYKFLNLPQEIAESIFKSEMAKELLTHIKPEYCWEKDGEKIKYIAKIELPSKYVKGVEYDK